MERIIRDLLYEKYNYTLREANETAKDLCAFKCEDLRKAVEQWVNTGEWSDVREGKYSALGLMKSHSFEYPAALIFIDWYRNTPQEAEDALKWMN